MRNVAKKLNADAATADDQGWRHFPKFEEVLSSQEPSPLMAMIEKTCRQLNDVLQGGADADKARAQAAMAGYGRSLDLLRILAEARDKAAQELATK
jgi:hypothetical protein